MTAIEPTTETKPRSRRAKPATQKVTVVLPSELVERLMSVAPSRQRSKFIEKAIAQQVQLAEQAAAIEEAAGIWKDEDYPHLLTAEEVDHWLSDLRKGWNRTE